MAEPELPSASALEHLNALPEPQARQLLARCCGAERWVAAMLASRPFATVSSLFARAEAIWQGLTAKDYLEAFSHHPEIGANLEELRRRFAGTAELSLAEQAGAIGASEATLGALGRQNQAYRERFGFSFIVCASGKTALEMLELLEARLGNSREQELSIAAAEQGKITRLRLEKLSL